MKKYLIALMIAPFLFSCGNGGDGSNPVEDSLNTVASGLHGQVRQKDSTIGLFIESFNEIQDNLDIIKEKEKIITVNSKDAELQKTQKDQIVDDIRLIYELMEKNKQRLASMSSKLKNANVKVSELEKMIARLTAQLQEKDMQIADLKTQLESMNLELANVTNNYREEKAQSTAKTEMLNTAYYAFGTAKELIKQGVLTKEGGFIGIGKSQKLKNDFNKNYFTKIDVTEVTSIPLGSKKARLVTSHPSDSYKLEGTKDKVEKITISNTDDFWSSSKYLVIVVE